MFINKFKNINHPFLGSLRIALIYAVFSALWILLSDNALLFIVRDPEILTKLQIIKGWCFVVVSAGIIFFLLYREIIKYHASKEKYRRLVEALKRDYFIYTHNNDGVFTQLSPSITSVLGYTQEEFLVHYSEFMPDNNINKDVKHHIEQSLKGIQQPPYEVEMFHKDKSVRLLEVLEQPVFDDQKNVVAVEGIAHDITERKRLDKQIRLLQHWVEHSVDFFFWVREDSQILYVNQAVCKTLGYTFEECCNMKVADFDLEITFEAWPDFIRKLKKQGSLCFETRVRKKEGQVFPMEITANVLEFEGRDHFFAYGRDITKKIKAETERNTLESKLRQAQKMESIGTLAGGIAHDFNNILSAIYGYTDLARMDINNQEKLQHDLDEIHSGAERAKELVRQILTFSRKTEQEKNPLQVSLVVKEALKLLRSSIPVTIEIREDINSTALAVADPTQIHQVVMNLCTNAYHAMRDSGGTLGVSLKEIEISETGLIPDLGLNAGIYLQLAISDSGSGMDDETISKIFEPYFTTKGVGEGTGLGLAVVHGVVEEYGGKINVYSELGQGTTFHIYLPVYEGDRAAATMKKQEVALKGGNETIMLVDDDVKIVEIARRSFQQLGYEIHTFTNGAQAYQEFQNHPDKYDLILTDMTMPYMTGAELSKKAIEMRPNLPIILCTGQSELINRKKALAMGITAYCEKPLNLKIILQTVRKVLDNTKVASK